METVKSASKGKRKNSQTSRRFKVGLVGAPDAAYERIARIFQNTEFRARTYQPVKISPNQLALRHQVDFIIMCSLNPTVVNAWKKVMAAGPNARPMIFLAKPGNDSSEHYQITAPINPAKLVKTLDHYTIKELNFFPEFVIGSESSELHDLAASGIRILRTAQKNSEVGGTSEARARALVVDDSLAVRRQMQIEFELQSADLDVAETAERAMEAIAKTTYDIIFLDVVMPGMDGYAACKKIKRSSLNKHTPVIMLTSRSGSFDKIKGTLAGCDSYLVKPLNHNDFEAVYQKYVNTKTQSLENGEKLHASK